MENKFTPAAANDHAATAWHTLHVEEVGKKLSTNLDKGLSRDESAHRFIQSGANALLEKPPRSLWRMLLDQFTDLMIMVLIVAAVISGVIGEMKDTVVIIAIVLLNALTGFIQEFRTARAMAALKQMTTANAQVMRDGERLTMPATEIVPGDIVLLEAGNLIPADLRLIETAQLKVDEALLTGESATVEKHSTQLENPELPLADRTNMAFKGTAATHGRGRGLVIATGMATGQDRRAAGCRRRPQNPAAEASHCLRPAPWDCRAVHLPHHPGGRLAARRGSGADAAHCDQPGRGGDSRGTARRRHHLAGAGRAQDG
jgi:Ca2+-transporting ATPase